MIIAAHEAGKDVLIGCTARQCMALSAGIQAISVGACEGGGGAEEAAAAEAGAGPAGAGALAGAAGQGVGQERAARRWESVKLLRS